MLVISEIRPYITRMQKKKNCCSDVIIYTTFKQVLINLHYFCVKGKYYVKGIGVFHIN